jgi:hypothetical protein
MRRQSLNCTNESAAIVRWVKAMGNAAHRRSGRRRFAREHSVLITCRSREPCGLLAGSAIEVGPYSPSRAGRSGKPGNTAAGPRVNLAMSSQCAALPPNRTRARARAHRQSDSPIRITASASSGGTRPLRPWRQRSRADCSCAATSAGWRALLGSTACFPAIR